jgi:tetratricopeptide (TPR) repeat protein
MTTLPMAQPAEEGQEVKKLTEAEQDYEDGVAQLAKEDDIAPAANLFHNALIGFEKENDINGVAKASDRLGDICAMRKDFDGAKKHYDRALEICQKAEDAFSIFEIDKKMADLHAICGNHKTAIDLYLDIIDDYQAMKNYEGVIKTFEKMADMYIEMNKRDMAADCYRSAAGIHTNFKHTRHAEALMKKAEEVMAG